LGWVGVTVRRVDVGVGWVGSVVVIEWGGVGIGCGICGLGRDGSRVLSRPHALSIVSVSVPTGDRKHDTSLPASRAGCIAIPTRTATVLLRNIHSLIVVAVSYLGS
jgi:hypothetical protein